ncbi:hypothetical protein PPYR_12143 [Photinus pyralis]|uniref:Transportin-1 n=1 Tax=Photinus pyralis TaxID=7054 RepID=A0A5N4ADA8_PHOPY|nr:hypothetical protein PPYR_12143 [Photinus pyralis]
MDVSQWSPNIEELNLVVELLQDSIIPDNEIQKKVQGHLLAMYKDPKFPNYLLYILQNSQLYEDYIRSLSAIILKNNILTSFETFSETVLTSLQEECFKLLLDSSCEVRSSVTTLMGILFTKIDLTKSSDLLPKLCNLLECGNVQVAETALIALFKICEEYCAKHGYKDPSITLLIDKFIALILCENTRIRAGCLKFVNHLLEENVYFDSKTLVINMLCILPDGDVQVQISLCRAFVSLVELQCVDIFPHISPVIEFIVDKVNSANVEIALQACEFWLALVKVDICKEVLGPYLHLILPILLKNMQYTAEELITLKNYIGIDEDLEDLPEDMQPFHGFNEEQNDAANEPYTGWTLRKCSAASLDALAGVFGDSLLQGILPLIAEALNSSDFIVRESGILALGAIAEGCCHDLHPHLPELFQYLFQSLDSEYSLIRVITCWTMSRYIVWLMKDEELIRNYFVPMRTILLNHFLDGNKRVQRACLSAFCVFQEEAKLRLIPHIYVILHAFSECFGKFKFASYLLLYDAIGVLARTVGIYLCQPDYINLLLPPLMQKLEHAKDYKDYQFMGLMDCLSNIAVAIESGFIPYAKTVFDRCMWIINDSLSGVDDALNCELPDWEPACVAHETLLGLALALKSHFPSIIANSNLISKLYFSLQKHSPQVRQPALALYGELVKHCFHLLEPTISDYLPIIINNLDIRYEPVCNNAAWVIGKLALVMGDKIAPYADSIMGPFLKIMVDVNGRKTVYQTVALALCTIGLISTDSVLPYLPMILRPCCLAMRNVADCEEKYIGFRGLCELIVRNPQSVIDNLVYFCDAVASFENVKLDVKEAVSNILVSYRFHFNAEFAIRYEQFPSVLKARLNKLYGF